jgi:hypothetical protein
MLISSINFSMNWKSSYQKAVIKQYVSDFVDTYCVRGDVFRMDPMIPAIVFQFSWRVHICFIYRTRIPDGSQSWANLWEWQCLCSGVLRISRLYKQKSLILDRTCFSFIDRLLMGSHSSSITLTLFSIEHWSRILDHSNKNEISAGFRSESWLFSILLSFNQ